MSRPVALVTGGGRGIGAAVCKRLAKDGFDVLLTYTTSSRPAEFVVDAIRESGGDALAVKIDCAAEDEVALLASHPWMARTVQALVLNHGRYDRVPASDLDLAQLDRTMNVNFRGAFLVWAAVQPHLADGARIVVVGSQLGTRGSPHGADYSASKAALQAWARSLAQEAGPRGQRVNVLAPGYVDTDLLAADTPQKRETREAEVPLRRLGSPEDMAGAVAFLIGEDSAYMTGAVLHVNGGLYLP